jgi:hypothetical protein
LKKYIFFVLLLSACQVTWHSPIYRTDFALQSSRQAFRYQLSDTLLALPFRRKQAPDSVWQTTFWAMELSLHAPDSLIVPLQELFGEYERRSPAFRRSLLEMMYALYPKQFTPEIETLLLKEKNEKLFAMQALYLARAKPENTEKLVEQMTARFANLQHPILFCLDEDLNRRISPFSYKLPDLADLLSFNKQQKHKVIYSFQRPDRNFPGLAVVQYADGKPARDKNGKLLVFEQFARSSSNLPFFITNGNTPQGVYSFSDTVNAQNRFIGPVPAFSTFLPFEASLSDFFHKKQTGTAWTEALYLSLFPQSWQEYPHIMEAFYAGRAGRTEILAHGTVIDTSFYKSEIFYPYTPSLGCLTAKEIWNPETGRQTESSQAGLLQAFFKTKGKSGFLYVIDLPGKNSPVGREELEALLKNW